MIKENAKHRVTLVPELLLKTIEYNNYSLFITLYLITKEFNIHIDPERLFITAAVLGISEFVKFIVETIGYSPKKQTSVEDITYVIRGNNLSILRYLVDKGWTLTPNAFGKALIDNNIDFIKYFVENKVALPDMDEYLPTILLGLGYKLLSYLQTHGYDILGIRELFMEAIRINKQSIISWFIEENRVILTKEDYRILSDMVADYIANDNFDGAQRLLNIGATINSRALKKIIYRIMDGSNFDEKFGVNFLKSNGFNLIENTKLVKQILIKETHDKIADILAIFISMAKKFTDNKKELNTFIFIIFKQLLKILPKRGGSNHYNSDEDEDDYFYDRIIYIIISNMDINTNSGRLFKFAVINNNWVFALKLIDHGANIFQEGVIGIVASKHANELLIQMFNANNKLQITNKDIEILNNIEYMIDVDTLRILINHGLNLSEHQNLLNMF